VPKRSKGRWEPPTELFLFRVALGGRGNAEEITRTVSNKLGKKRLLEKRGGLSPIQETCGPTEKKKGKKSFARKRTTPIGGQNPTRR